MTTKAVSRFEIAILVLMMAEFYPDIRATSTFIGTVAGCNPVVVRGVYGKLKAAELLDAKPGPYGLHLLKDTKDISLWDIFCAVENAGVEELFALGSPLSGTCTISENIHGLVLRHLERAFEAARNELEAVSLYDFAWQLPDTYEIPVEDKLRIMHDSLVELEKSLREGFSLSPSPACPQGETRACAHEGRP